MLKNEVVSSPLPTNYSPLWLWALIAALDTLGRFGKGMYSMSMSAVDGSVD